MEDERARIIIAEINQWVQKHAWMDFQVMNYDGCRLTIIGSRDTTCAHELEIWFETVAFVSIPMVWSTDTTQPPLELVSGEDERAANLRFQVIKGNHIFRVLLEDYPREHAGLIGATRVGYRLMDAAG